MAQYRGRVKADCGASTANQLKNSSAENEGVVPSDKQALLEKEEENTVSYAKYYVFP